MFNEAIQRITGLARRPGPLLVSVESRAGSDPLPAVLRALPPARRFVFLSPSLTDAENLGAFLDGTRHLLPENEPASSEWSQALAALGRNAPLTLVFGGARSLSVANRRLWRSWGDAWIPIRRSGARVHIFLVDDQYGLAETLNAADSPFRDPTDRLGPGPDPDPVECVRIGPASHYDLGRSAPAWTGMDLLIGWSLLGGNPTRWGAGPGTSSPLRAARALCLSPHGPPSPIQVLERAVQAPHRYASILKAVAGGARSWRDVASAVGSASGARSATGPYLERLGDLGLIAVDKPLGAVPKIRRSRYRLTDPHDVFWWARFHPLRSAFATAENPETLWRDELQPALRSHVMAVLPDILLSFLRRGAAPFLGAVAREVGPLWGDGFDFPAAATLRNGAVCYAHIHAGPGAADLSMLAALEDQMRAARYGFGRQARIRLLVSITGFGGPLKREAARNSLVRLVGVRELSATPAQGN